MRSFTLAVVAGLFLIVAGSAQAAPVVDGVFSLPAKPTINGKPALGPDGNVWVTLQSGNPDFAKVAPDGTVTPYTAAAIDNPTGIIAGPDGNMWITGLNYVGRFSTADPTTVVATATAEIGSANHIVVGSDGNLWTGSDGKVVRITPTATPVITGFPVGIGGFNAKGIAAGTDGNLWVADGGNGGVVPVTTAGTIGTEVTLGGMVQQVAAGPNGQIAYTNPGATPEKIGLINGGIAATPLPFPVPPDPFGITLGQDGAYWIAQFNSTSIGRYTATGDFTELAGLPAASGPRQITSGAGNTLWVTLELTDKIARISGVANPVDPFPEISKVSVTNKTFKVGAKKTPITSKTKKTPTGTTLKYTLSEAITANIDVHRAVAGRVKGKNCVKPTSKLKKAKKCTRYKLVKAFTKVSKIGANKFAFSGRFGKTTLKPGKYRFLVYGKDAAGGSATPRDVKFKIVKK